jgi:GLPGLI family protein
MKVKIFLSLSFVLVLSFLKAQDIASYSFKYKLTYVIDTTQPETPDIAYFILLTGKNSSKFVDFVDESSGVVYSTIISRQPIYKNFSNNKIIREIRMGQAVYAITDDIPVINWELGKEQKMIQGYNCQVATGFYRGRIYTAWFSNKLPYKNGPWKFGGLPGLILEIYDQKHEVTWELQNISDQIDPSLKSFDISRNDITVTQEEFTKLNEALIKDPGAMRGATTNANLPPGISVSVVRRGSEDAGAKKMRKFNNPIEKSK